MGRRTTRLRKLMDAVGRTLGQEIGLTNDGERIGCHHTCENLGLEDGAVFHVHEQQKGGKPVIYLQPPRGREINAEVRLSLIPQWNFSAIYPVVPVERQVPDSKGDSTIGERIEWNVLARSDGALVDSKSGTKVAYLYWEAE